MTQKEFKKTVYDYYKYHGRRLPWRLSSATPYHILVSEIMLQQTQVDRVIEKYKFFIKKYPTPQKLTVTSTGELYGAWKGLGYNRRALALQKTAQIIVRDYKGNVPKEHSTLVSLPGIGPYTASAIQSFAFNTPAVVVETNIRSAFIFHFFKNRTNVSDKELLPRIEKTLDTKNPRIWYSALMDYGSMIKKVHSNASRRSAHYTKQKPFKGSRREVRGGILKILHEKPAVATSMLASSLNRPSVEITSVLLDLEKEGFVVKKYNSYSLN